MDTLIERYDDATTIADKLLYLDALANTGSHRVLPIMQDAIHQGQSYDLACAGAFGLRRIPGDDVDDLLAALIQNGTVVIVPAIKATAYHSPPSGSRASSPSSRSSRATSASPTRSRPCSSPGPSSARGRACEPGVTRGVAMARRRGREAQRRGRGSARAWQPKGPPAAGTATESRRIASAAVEAQHRAARAPRAPP